MSIFALAHELGGSSRGAAKPGRRLRTVAVPWTDVPVSRLVAFPGTAERRGWILAAGLAACAIAVHAGFVWYVEGHTADGSVPPRKHEVAAEL